VLEADFRSKDFPPLTEQAQNIINGKGILRKINKENI
jgi:hypothetical protein